jgi:hypothetical protein
MRVIDLGPGGANDINDAGQVVGESLVATGGKLPLAGTVLSRFPPEDRTPFGRPLRCEQTTTVNPTMPFKSTRRKAPTRASLANEVT